MENMDTPMFNINAQEEEPTAEASCSDPVKLNWFRCKKCPFRTYCFKTFVSHGVEVHEEKFKKKYSCDKCLYSAAKKWKLELHLQYHEDIPGIFLYKCLICPFVAPIKCQLDRHLMFLHPDRPDAKKFKCIICDSEFISRSLLIKHKKTHK